MHKFVIYTSTGVYYNESMFAASQLVLEVEAREQGQLLLVEQQGFRDMLKSPRGAECQSLESHFLLIIQMRKKYYFVNIKEFRNVHARHLCDYWVTSHFSFN